MRRLLVPAALSCFAFARHDLPQLPRAISGQCAGVSNGALMVIGGSYFSAPPFEGGKKIWVDTIYVLSPGAAEWKTFRSERPIAYAACVTAPEGLIVAGGGGAHRNYREAFRLAWADGRPVRTALPSLPEPLANAAAALLGRTVFITGGQKSPAAVEASRDLFALDLDHVDRGWKRLEQCPGPARVLPVFGTAGDALYMASGAELTVVRDGAAKRKYLRDSWRYQAGRGWRQMTDAPRPVAAAPVLSRSRAIYVFGGDDGENADRIQELKNAHPGFSRQILAWTPETGSWTEAGDYPAGLVTTMAVEWSGLVVIPGGEDKPGQRSANVIAFPSEQHP